MTVEQLTVQGTHELLGSEEMRRILWRLSCELREHHAAEPAVLCGIVTRGAFLADRLLQLIRSQGGGRWDGCTLDVGRYRDDEPRLAPSLTTAFPLPFATADSVRDRVVVLVDDVLFHGRTGRAALAALAELGRPRSVELLVVVDRGHRELPLRATYVGRNLPTSEGERVLVRLAECDERDAVLLRPSAEPRP
ncbi:MAG TPA: bifunctional pyr operon transcriptional regulator/uracil phosphoribosyltransferase PyrR [Candidatus Dormibacteraeota bacterium]|nr:bifunctional pyr operon transcriptional regulator/uracil phosphoribosyltransferase PyrR [Candidatus Dormibacteraeota bacterium]